MLHYFQTQYTNFKKQRFEKKYSNLCNGPTTILKEKQKLHIAEVYSFYLPAKNIDNDVIVQFNQSIQYVISALALMVGSGITRILIPKKYRSINIIVLGGSLLFYTFHSYKIHNIAKNFPNSSATKESEYILNEIASKIK